MSQYLQFAEQIPVEVQQLAEAYHLGTPTAIYNKTSNSPVAFGCTIAFLVPFYIAPLITLWPLISNHTFLQQPAYLLIIFDLVWYGILILITWGVTSMYRNRHELVVTYTEGFVYQKRRKTEVLRWEWIETIWRGVEDEGSVNLKSMRIRKTDGTQFSFAPMLRDSLEICDAIEREFVRVRSPGMIEQYDAGGILFFDKLGFQLGGISNGKDILPWSSVASIEVSKNHVTIKKEGKMWPWYWRPVPQVPNACLLRELVTHIRGYQQ